MVSGLCRQMGLIPVDAEYAKEHDGYVLRIAIDKEGGVGINECEALSRRIDPMLDEENFIPDVYTLEVTSPGLGRVLRRPRDFIFGKGKEVEARLFKAVDGEKDLVGTLDDFDDKTITLGTEKGPVILERSNVSQLRLTFDF